VLKSFINQNDNESIFMERLAQILPVMGTQKLSLNRLNTYTIAIALNHYDLVIPWNWEPVGSWSELVNLWPLEPDERLLAAHPATQRVVQSTTRQLDEALFDGQDIIILGEDTRFVGLFDEQFKHAYLRPRRLFPDPLHFYSVTHEFGEFSNFAPYAIRVDGNVWKTSEHYFQAQKFVGTPHEEVVRQAKTPMEAARMGRQRDRPLRKDWESSKVHVMRRALHAKFTQHEELRQLLVATTPCTLAEHTKNDAFWGDGGDGKGYNWLGRLLMELREMLMKESV